LGDRWQLGYNAGKGDVNPEVLIDAETAAWVLKAGVSAWRESLCSDSCSTSRDSVGDFWVSTHKHVREESTHRLLLHDLNKPLTEFFKTKILADRENHKLIASIGTLSIFSLRQDRFLNRGVLAHSPSVLQRGD
jgi:hypothetical protein